MELESSGQTSSEYLQKQRFSALIAVAGYESRSAYLISKIDVSDIPNKVALAYSEQRGCVGKGIVDHKFEEAGFTFHDVSISNPKPLTQILDTICEEANGKDIDILIDYTCMSKIWYNAIIEYFHRLEEEIPNAQLWFVYAPSDHRKPLDLLGRDTKNTVPKISGNKPLALLVGLGCDKDASELLSIVKTPTTFGFFPQSVIDERYSKEVKDTNQKFIKNIDPDKFIEYPLLDLNAMYCSLNNICVNLRLTHETVLVPVGPKPFSLMCSIVSARYPDIKLWNVPSNAQAKIVDRKPHGELLLYKVVFTSEEVDY